MLRHFVDLFDISADDARTLIDRAIQLKRAERRGDRPPLLSGRTLGLIFEKPSLRTRVSFEAAIARLGGNAIFLRGEDVGLGTRESVVDFARVISEYVDGLAVRTYSHATIEEEGLLERGTAIGERFRARFEGLRDELGGLIRDVHILGTMIGLDLTIDAAEIVGRCMERRLLINATHGHVIRLLPALTITDEQIDEGCDILADVLRQSAA